MNTIIVASKNAPKVKQLARTVSRVAAARGKQVAVMGMTDLNINSVQHSTDSNIVEAARTKVRSLSERCPIPGICAAESWELVIPALDNKPGRYVKHWLGQLKAQEAEQALLNTMRPFRNMNDRVAFIVSAISYENQTTGETGSFRRMIGGYILKSPDHGALNDVGLRPEDHFFSRVFLPEFIAGHPENQALHRLQEKMRDFGPRARAFQDFAEAIC